MCRLTCGVDLKNNVHGRQHWSRCLKDSKETKQQELRQNCKIYLRESKQARVDIGEQGKQGAVRDEAGRGKWQSVQGLAVETLHTCVQ